MTTAPLPAAERQAANDALPVRLAARIRQQGPLRFDEYMEQALYAPELGYYERAHPVFGAQGDFVTAPGVGEIFAGCIARFCDFTRDGQDRFAIAEYGPGTGELARDVMQAMASLPDDYWLLERSARQRQRQIETLAELSGPAQWGDALPDRFEGVVLANEFLDALPARCFEMTDAGVKERRVGVGADGAFGWELQVEPQLRQEVDAMFSGLEAPPAPGYCSEWRQDACRNWLDELDRAMRRGFVLILDYGYTRREYYHPQRTRGTLRCHTRHQAHSDPFRRPGEEDISVDVDFTAVAELAQERGFEVLLFTSHAGFLLEYGLLESVDETVDEMQQLVRRGQIRMLTHPEQMGERFKAMLLGRDVSFDLPYAICPDHRNRL